MCLAWSQPATSSLLLSMTVISCTLTEFDFEEFLHMAAAAEASSEHPLARAVLSYARKCLRVTSSNLDLALPGTQLYQVAAVLVRNVQCNQDYMCMCRSTPLLLTWGCSMDAQFATLVSSCVCESCKTGSHIWCFTPSHARHDDSSNLGHVCRPDGTITAQTSDMSAGRMAP